MTLQHGPYRNKEVKSSSKWTVNNNESLSMVYYSIKLKYKHFIASKFLIQNGRSFDVK